MVRLIVGLGNPGSDYQKTRHNVGVWLINALCQQYAITLSKHLPSKGFHAIFSRESLKYHLLTPITFMNYSGYSVSQYAQYYRIKISEILVVHDELDLVPGMARLKQGGGAGGHNGLKNIITNLDDNSFWRLRLGIGHPGNKAQVTNYVLSQPKLDEYEKIQQAIQRVKAVFNDLLQGNIQQAMKILHTSDIKKFEKFSLVES